MSSANHEGRDSEHPARRFQAHLMPEKRGGELQLIGSVMARFPPEHRILVVPCSTGRVMIYLLGEGRSVTGADVSEAKLAEVREHLAQMGRTAVVERQDLRSLTYAFRSFDVTLCSRLFYHLPDTGLRRTIASELCRVTDKYVLLMYCSPWSFGAIRLKLRVTLGGHLQDWFPTSLSELKGYFHPCGFRLVKDFARLPLLRTLHLAVWQRL